MEKSQKIITLHGQILPNTYFEPNKEYYIMENYQKMPNPLSLKSQIPILIEIY